jgi:hypothetical protein
LQAVSEPGNAKPQCELGKQCTNALSAIGREHLLGLLGLADTNSSGYAFLLAHTSCQRFTHDKCSELGAARWAQLDAGNVQSWLAMAQDAEKRKDTAARRDALLRITTATTNHSGWDVTIRMIQSHMPADFSVLERATASASHVGILAALPSRPYQQLVSVCRPATAGSAPLMTRSQCESVAATLYKRSDHYLGLAIGASLYRATGSTSPDAEEALQRRDALSYIEERVYQQEPSFDDAFSCKSITAHDERLRETIAAGGEVAYIEKRMQAMNLTQAEAAAQYRAARKADQQRAEDTALSSALMPFQADRK